MIHYFPYLKQNIGLNRVSDSILRKMLSYAKVRTFSPKENLVGDGVESGRIYFIVKGIVKGLFTHLEEQVCSRLYKAGDVVSDYSSLEINQHNAYHVECVGYVTALYLDREDFYHLMEEQTGLKQLYLENLSNEIYKYELRVRGLLCYSAKERYLKFVEYFGEYISCLSQKDIASYLAMKPETLSRIKKSLNG